ncbi:DMT family transporter [Alistipes provencensis]|uniref:DMT family transporter n=1 Tax=Alistipes provencensis TaxID=1816676 RepID=UPI0007EE12CD|nr:DMT family transporter [Alistipes provencensis]
MISERSRGYVLGAIAAASYGLNPLFALPLYGVGMSPDSVLFYRYVLAVVMLGALMLFRRQSFALTRHDILPLAVMGVLFALSSLLLFQSYNLMDAGIASTILFVYPVMVAVIMAVGFHERVTAATVFSIALACGGIGLLYKGGDGATLSLVGVLLVFLSALAYAVYIVGVNRSSLKNLSTEKLTFYSLLFGSLVYVVRLRGGADLQAIPSPLMWVNAVSLALFPTIVSLVTMAGAIRRIGSTPTAILGALEPVTALFFGVVVFGEQFTLRIGVGVSLILVAVTLIIAGKSIRIPTSVTHLARWMARPRLPRWAVRWAHRLPLPRIRRTK